MEASNANLDYCILSINQLESLNFVANFYCSNDSEQQYEMVSVNADADETQNVNLPSFDQSFTETTEVPNNIQTPNAIEIKKTQTSITRKEIIKNAGPFKCPACDKVYLKRAQYRLHLRKHHAKKRFQCHMCSESFNQEVNFKIHVTLHETGAPECPLCGRKFQRWASLRAHLLTHKTEETLICFCQKEFDNEEEYNKHMEVHEGEQVDDLNTELPLRCSHCNYLFEDIIKYKEHMMLHIKAKRFLNVRTRSKTKKNNFKHKCEYCNKSFPKYCLLMRHLRTHTGEKPFTCEICGRRFSQKGSLQSHVNQHNNVLPYACMFCPATFGQKGNLRVHIIRTHSQVKPGEKIYKCSQCMCVFKKISSLNGHITKAHVNAKLVLENDDHGKAKEYQSKRNDEQATNETEYSLQNENEEIAKEAEESFVKIVDGSVGDSLKRYTIRQKIIGENRWYLCNYCDKSFKKPSDLIRHIRIHTKEKPYKCNSCGSCFTQKSTLISHLTRHKVHEFECVICNSKFSSMKSLNVHLKKHDTSVDASKSENYKCSHCDKIFFDINVAKKHLKEHQVQPYELNMGEEENPSQIPQIPTNEDLNSTIPIDSTGEIANEIKVSKPFKCLLCENSFRKGHHLKRHMLTHFNANKINKAAFKNPSEYNEHVKSHLNKQFSCAVCTESFFTLESFQKHIKMHNLQTISPLINLPENVVDNEQEKGVTEISEESKMTQLLNTVNLQEANHPVFFTLEDLQLQIPNQNVGVLTSSEIAKPVNVTAVPNDIPQCSVNVSESNEEPFTQQTISYETISNILNQGLTDITLVPLKPKPEDELQNMMVLNTTQNQGESLDKSIDILNYYNLNLPEYIGSEEFTTDNSENNKANATSVTDVASNGDVDAGNGNATEEIKGANEKEASLDCPNCSKKLTNRNAFLRHISRKHNIIVDKSCPFCRKVFTKKSDLDRHTRIHTGEKPFKCTKCERSFRIKSTLDSHLRTHNPIVVKNFKCQVCKLCFLTKSSLKTHMLVHAEKQHTCEICLKKFRTIHHKRKHILAHHQEKPPHPAPNSQPNLSINCFGDVLYTDATDVNGLEEPITIRIENPVIDAPEQDLIHTLPMHGVGQEDLNERISIEPLLLQLNSNYSRADESEQITMYNGTEQGNGGNDLEQDEPYSHVSKERKFQCDVCLKFYVSKSVLNKHKKALHGDYKCDKCSKAYNSRELLAKHYSSHDGSRPISCLYCSNTFTAEANLKVHIRRMHKAEQLFHLQ